MGGLNVYFGFVFYFCMIICLNRNITSTLHVTKIFDSQLNDSLGNIFSRISVWNQTKVVRPVVVFDGNLDGRFNDSRCNQTVINSIKYLNSLNSTDQYVECVNAGVGKMRACLEDGVMANISGVNCVIKNKFLSISNFSLRSLTKNLLLVPEELQFKLNVTECGEEDVNCAYYNETKVISNFPSNFTECNETILNTTQGIIFCSKKNSSSLTREFSLRSLKNLTLASNDIKLVFNESRCNEEVSNEIKYLNYSVDPSKVVECVSFGIGLLHDCFEDGPWVNSSLIDCSKNESDTGVNEFPDLEPLIPTFSNYSFDSQNSSKCVNGVLDVFSTKPDCICLMDFVGDWCEATMTNKNFTTYYSQVLNETFDMNSYEPFLKIRSGRPCFVKLINLLGSQNQVLVDYKSFIDNIVGNYWTQFDKQGWFMQNVDYENVWNNSDAGYQIQKMRFYTQKVYDDLSPNFIKYRRTLKRLSKIYKNSSDTIFRKAKSFGKIMPFSNFTIYEIKIKNEVGVALKLVTKIYDDFLSFFHTGNVSNVTVSSIGLLKESTFKYSNMVNDYGFWYFINKLSSSAKYITNYNQFVANYKTKTWLKRISHLFRHFNG